MLKKNLRKIKYLYILLEIFRHGFLKLKIWVLMKLEKFLDHDELLTGERKGQRSIRLSKAYRAFYIEYDILEGNINIIEVTEVNKHEY